MKIKKGDIVGRISYKKDILFIVDRLINVPKTEEIAILKGLTSRIEADSYISDLEVIDKKIVEQEIENCQKVILNRIEYSKEVFNSNFFKRQKIYTGKILHLDGDRKYTEKSIQYYNKLNLNAVVKNIAESRQENVVIPLLNKYNPDILIITGHDAMIKRGNNYHNIYNYRNSRYFINTVREARKWGRNSEKLVIFAGACQSYFEGIMNAGADFASSPGRILIDFIDPLIVAEKIATTYSYQIVSNYEIAKDIREGLNGINGIGARGKKRIIA